MGFDGKILSHNDQLVAMFFMRCFLFACSCMKDGQQKRQFEKLYILCGGTIGGSGYCWSKRAPKETVSLSAPLWWYSKQENFYYCKSRKNVVPTSNNMSFHRPDLTIGWNYLLKCIKSVNKIIESFEFSLNLLKSSLLLKKLYQLLGVSTQMHPNRS